MQRDESCEQALLETNETRQIGVRKQVTAVMVVAGMSNIEAYLVQPRRPGEKLTIAVIGELPALRDLIDEGR